MRSIPLLLVALSLAACGERMLDVEQDYTEEVEQLCSDLCEKVVTCVEPPLFETREECQVLCTVAPSEVYEDSACGEAFRAYYRCIGGTATCEEYLDTQNVLANDHLCKTEGDVIVGLMCGAREGND